MHYLKHILYYPSALLCCSFSKIDILLTSRFALKNDKLSCFRPEHQDPMQPVYSGYTPEEVQSLFDNNKRRISVSPHLLTKTKHEGLQIEDDCRGVVSGEEHGVSIHAIQKTPEKMSHLATRHCEKKPCLSRTPCCL